MTSLLEADMLTRNQWSHIKRWIALVVIAEGLMLLFNRYLFVIYLVIALLFLGGLGLRILNLYPGKRGPLMLDAPTVLIAVIFAYISKWLGGSNLRFILLFISSIIILPHLLYIISKKDI